ncbi:PhzF family phenazine biosynthesis protein [Paraburkholderia hospita]|uniref:PhzF family phenazine biosynthesis protein n=1 Tax=Paraburkholderia hospita TaxID=169430 RepID=UPI000DEFC39A|nr:PhzF family phenazine biosynthesis protein [Paraburkholderia hospita]AXF06396.1 PhzF family phenazine biosynthesis protein [Paraburkholderia hospita]
MIHKMYQVDSFSGQVFGGNPAAVLVLDEWLPDSLMQAVAAENNLAETAFVKPAGDAWDLRWFTPTVEVDFCGHATLAAAHVLVTEYAIPGPLSFSARVGQLKVEILENGYLLDLPCIHPDGASPLPAAIQPLFCDIAVCHFRNFENIFIELTDEDAVRSYKPDLNKLAELGPVGLVITAKSQDYDFVSRYFAPGAGIPEDPVTGSIHATLVPFWAEHLGKNKLSAFQASQRGGHLLCELKENRVTIEGKAATFMKAEIYLPD